MVSSASLTSSCVAKSGRAVNLVSLLPSSLPSGTTETQGDADVFFLTRGVATGGGGGGAKGSESRSGGELPAM